MMPTKKASSSVQISGPDLIKSNSLTLSGANAVSSVAVDMGASILPPQNQVAELLYADVYITNAHDEFVAGSDYAHIALATANHEEITTFAPTDNRIIKYIRFQTFGAGAAGMEIHIMPYTIKFKQHSDKGGRFVIPDQLYWVVDTAGLASALSLLFELHYLIKTVPDSIATRMLSQLNRV